MATRRRAPLARRTYLLLGYSAHASPTARRHPHHRNEPLPPGMGGRPAPPPEPGRARYARAAHPPSALPGPDARDRAHRGGLLEPARDLREARVLRQGDEPLAPHGRPRRGDAQLDRLAPA